MPLKFILANANPARAENKTCPMVVRVDTKRLLKKYLLTGIWENTFFQFCSVGVNPFSIPVIFPSGVKETASITKNGNSIVAVINIIDTYKKIKEML